jgi:hypothetical protein
VTCAEELPELLQADAGATRSSAIVSSEICCKQEETTCRNSSGFGIRVFLSEQVDVVGLLQMCWNLF